MKMRPFSRDRGPPNSPQSSPLQESPHSACHSIPPVSGPLNDGGSFVWSLRRNYGQATVEIAMKIGENIKNLSPSAGAVTRVGWNVLNRCGEPLGENTDAGKGERPGFCRMGASVLLRP